MLEANDKKENFLVGFVAGMLHIVESYEATHTQGDEEKAVEMMLEIFKACSAQPLIALALASKVYEVYYYNTVGKDEVQ